MWRILIVIIDPNLYVGLLLARRENDSILQLETHFAQPMKIELISIAPNPRIMTLLVPTYIRRESVRHPASPRHAISASLLQSRSPFCTNRA